MHFSFLIYFHNLSSTCFEYSNYSSSAGSYCMCSLSYLSCICVSQLLRRSEWNYAGTVYRDVRSTECEHFLFFYLKQSVTEWLLNAEWKHGSLVSRNVVISVYANEMPEHIIPLFLCNDGKWISMCMLGDRTLPASSVWTDRGRIHS